MNRSDCEWCFIEKLRKRRNPSATVVRGIDWGWPFFDVLQKLELRPPEGAMRSLCNSQSNTFLIFRCLQFTTTWREPLGQGVLASKQARTQTSSRYLTASICCNTLTQCEVKSLSPAR